MISPLEALCSLMGDIPCAEFQQAMESRKKRNDELFYRKQKSFSLAGLKHILIRAIERAGIGMDVKDREEFVERMGAPAYENPTAA